MSPDQASSSPAAFPRRPAWQTYIRRYFTGMAIFIVLFAPVAWLGHAHALPGRPWIYAVAVTPAVGLVVAIWAHLRFLEEETDEYQRLLNARAFIVATGLTLVIATAWGLMQWYADVPKVSLFYVFPLFFSCQGVANGWVRWMAR